MFRNNTHNFISSIQETAVPKVKELTKVLYDFTKNEEVTSTRCTALPELIIQDFVEEQIWQQIELQNQDKWTSFLSSVSTILTQKDVFKIPVTISSKAQSDAQDSDGSNQDNPEVDTSHVSRKLTKKKTKKSKSKTRKLSIIVISCIIYVTIFGHLCFPFHVHILTVVILIVKYC